MEGGKCDEASKETEVNGCVLSTVLGRAERLRRHLPVWKQESPLSTRTSRQVQRHAIEGLDGRITPHSE